MTVPADRTLDNSLDVARKFSTSALEDDAVTAEKIAPGAVEGSDLADGSVVLAKTAQFISTPQTGTGSSQDIAHGLGVVPAAVVAVPVDLSAATIGDYAVTEGAHDATNVVVTVTSGKDFKIIAWA